MKSPFYCPPTSWSRPDGAGPNGSGEFKSDSASAASSASVGPSVRTHRRVGSGPVGVGEVGKWGGVEGEEGVATRWRSANDSSKQVAPLLGAGFVRSSVPPTVRGMAEAGEGGESARGGRGAE